MPEVLGKNGYIFLSLGDFSRDSSFLTVSSPSVASSLVGTVLCHLPTALSLLVSMSRCSKKKFRPPFAGSSRGRCLIRSIRNSAMAKKKAKSISLVDLPDFDVPASGHLALGLPLSSSSSPMAGSPLFSFGSLAPVQFQLIPGVGPLNTQALLPVSASPLSPRSVSPPAVEAFPHPGLGSALGGSVSGHGFALAGSRSEIDGLKSTVVGSVSTDGGSVSVSGFGSAAAAGSVGFGYASGSAGLGSAGLGSAAASVGFGFVGVASAGSAAASVGTVSGLSPSAENVSLPTVSSSGVGSASLTAVGSAGIRSDVVSAGHGSAAASVGFRSTTAPGPLAPPVLDAVPSPTKNYAELLKSSAQLQVLGSPIEHVSGAPFVLIPDENIEAAKLEFKDFIYARFHGDYPSMGKIIGVVNAVWARTGPKIFVHNIGEGMYLLRVTTPRTRDVLLSRTCWNIGGLPMFVAPWAPDFSPDEPPLTSAIVPVEMRNVPYLLFNRESLSRIATAIGKPDCLAPETERKENLEVAKLYVRVDLTSPLPSKIISGFSNGREVEIDVSYPWLPNKCALCNKFGHTEVKCPNRANGTTVEKQPLEIARRRSKSRPGRSTEKKLREGVLRYVPVNTGPQDPMTRSTTDAVPDSGKDSLPPTSSLPSDETIELEEGEILQQSLEDTQLSLSETAKVSMEDNNDVASPGEVVPAVEKIVPVPSQALVAEVDTVVVQGVLDDIANHEATLPVAIVQGLLGNKASHEPTLSTAAEQVLQIAHDSQESSQPPASELSEVEKTIIEEAPIPILSEVDDLSSDVILEVNNNANPPCGNSDESINIPPPAVEESIDIPPPVEVEEGANNVIPPMEEEEGGDPFYLVKNRKSGRKAAKRH
ncbi:hypothetical protein IGI04_003726 [Brassica rapa subsp. trilocularis]|uniref:DUF4283 domain-containing protein n=1 Tax=Brassica rapa subsp. trilocularis TaxID=1813537 RepID=A0ABQ7P2R8_BRACM|nr:hypothetical protein IGI04_003726 [Brassica rapa subsp. trilocularis]